LGYQYSRILTAKLSWYDIPINSLNILQEKFYDVCHFPQIFTGLFQDEVFPNAGKLYLGIMPVLYPHTEKSIFPIPFKLNGIYIMATVFHSIYWMEFHLVQNRTENCHHDHIPFKVKGIGNIVFSLHYAGRRRSVRTCLFTKPNINLRPCSCYREICVDFDKYVHWEN